MADLCKFLSKLPTATETGDVGEPSYYNPGDPKATPTPIPPFCATPTPSPAVGSLGGEDISDEWKVDLKVPPVVGSIGQDWPVSCKDWTVANDGQDYGCDLWIEVTNIAPLI